MSSQTYIIVSARCAETAANGVSAKNHHQKYRVVSVAWAKEGHRKASGSGVGDITRRAYLRNRRHLRTGECANGAYVKIIAKWHGGGGGRAV